MSRISEIPTISSIDSNDSNCKKLHRSSNINAVEKVLSPYATSQIEDNHISDRMMARYERIKIQTNCHCGNMLIRNTSVIKTNCDKCKKNIEVNDVIFSCPKMDTKLKHRYIICEQCAIDILLASYRNQTLYDSDDDTPSPYHTDCGIRCVIQ